MSEGWTYELTFRGETFELTEAEQIAGRSRTCDISVPDSSVSRKHARLQTGPGHVLVQDLDSSNGTFINGRRIQGEDAAEDGDVLRFGDAELTLSIVSLSSYQTMRLSTAAAEARKPPGPATTMLAAESVRLAEQAEVDRQARQAAEAGRPAESIPVVPEMPRPAVSESPVSEPAVPEPAVSEPAPSEPTVPTTAAPEPQSPPTARPKQPATDSPLATQRLEMPPTEPRESREAPWAHAADGDNPSPAQTQRFDSSAFQAPAAAESSAPKPTTPQPTATESPEPSPLQTQRFDSGAFASPPAQPSLADSSSPEPSPPEPSSPHTTQRFDSGSFGLPQPSAPPESSEPAPRPSPEPESSPLETQRMSLPSVQPPADSVPSSTPSPPSAPPSMQPPASQPPAADPPAAHPPAATVAMTAEQLRAARGEADAPPADMPPADAYPAGPSPSPPDPGPSFDEGSELSVFDLDEPESSQVQPPADFVPGSGRAWQQDPKQEAVPPPPPPGPSPSASPPEPTSQPPQPPSEPPSQLPSQPLAHAEPGLVPPSYPDSRPATPPPPPAEPSSGPSFDRPVTSWAEKPPGDGDAAFAGQQLDSRGVSADDDSWEPPDFAEGGGSFESSWVATTADSDPPPASSAKAATAAPGPGPSFDQPTAPASPPSSPPASGFDRPTPPAAPPPAEMPREERTTGGAGGLLPTLDEIDGAIASPEMEVPYQPDPDPTAPVPVAGHRRVDAGAGFLLRALATLLDMMWISALTVAAWMVSGSDQLVSLVVNVLCITGIVVGWALWGTTPGKKALGLTVEGRKPDPESGGIGFLRAVIRAAGYLVSTLTLGVGFLMIAFSSEKRGLHDRIAGTWVRRHG